MNTEKIDLIKEVFNKAEYLKTINTEFSELGTTTISEDQDNETTVEVDIPLDEIKVKKTRGHKTDLKITDEVTITMGYPSLDSFVNTNFVDDQGDIGVDQIFEMAGSCIRTISDPEQVYDCQDVPKKEIQDFFEGMDTKQFQMIQDFFETMPKLTHTVKVKNPNTNVESDIVLEGLASFFA